MAKPEEYPFMRVAKQYGVDYGAVLRYVQHVRGPRLEEHELPTFETVNTVLALGKDGVKAVFDANKTMRLIQSGKIDWQTGEQP